MKSVLIIGLGKFGRTIALKLSELNHEVMAVDKDEKCVNAVMPFVTNGIIGDSTNEEFLKSLGVRNFDLCYVTIGDSFQDSLETTSLLKDLGAKMVVARSSGEVHSKFLLRNGADKVVFPEKQVAEWAAIRYSTDHIFDYIAMNDDYAIFEISVPEQWAGKTVGDLDVRQRYKVNILAVKRGGQSNMDISSETSLEAGETILVLGKTRDMQKCFRI
ncbi:MAG: potassium channel family protein [Bilifractor porci]|jgi:trk system potassium uptake protein TrkA